MLMWVFQGGEKFQNTGHQVVGRDNVVNLDDLKSLFPLEPFVLTAGILPGGELDGGDGFGEAALFGEMGADFADANGFFCGGGKWAECGDLCDYA